MVLLPTAWSPDGTKLVVGLLPWTVSRQLELCLIDGKHDTCLPTIIKGDGPTFAWSPDGERIAFIQPDGKLATARADESDPVNLLSGMQGYSIAWR